MYLLSCWGCNRFPSMFTWRWYDTETISTLLTLCMHDDVIKWKHFPRNWPFVREIHRSPVNFPYKGQWRGALMFSLIYAWINDWVNNREAGDLRRQHGHYDVIVMEQSIGHWWIPFTKNPEPGLCLNVKTLFPRYGDSYVKDKTVGETVLSLTWESLYW